MLFLVLVSISLIVAHYCGDILRYQLLGILHDHHDETGIVGIVHILLIVFTIPHYDGFAQGMNCRGAKKSPSLLKGPCIVIMWCAGHL